MHASLTDLSLCEEYSPFPPLRQGELHGFAVWDTAGGEG